MIFLTRVIGLLVIAGLTVGIFVAFQFGGKGADVGPKVEELFSEAEFSRSRSDNAATSLKELRVKYEKVIQAAPDTHWAQRSLLRLAALEQKVGNARMAFEYLYRNINGYPESNLTAKARFMAGRIWETDVGDLERALVSYRAVVNAYLPRLAGNGGQSNIPERARLTPTPDLRDIVFNALVAAASAEIRLGEFDAAANTLQRAVARFPNHGKIEMLQMRLADILADHLDRRLEARAIWANLLRENEESIWTRVAEGRLKDAW